MFNYAEKLREFIPSNVIALSISTEGVINMASLDNQEILSWILFVSFVIGLPFYIWLVQKKDKFLPIFFAVLAFIILELALGGPFEKSWPDASGTIKAIGGVVALIFAGFVVPIIAAVTNRS